MLMVCHHLDASIAEDLAFAESRIRKGDDCRRRHPARPGRHQHDEQRQPGHGPRGRSHPAHLADRAQDEGAARKPARRHARNDNTRIKRYVAKYTINPAIAHGIAHEVGSLEVGKWADIVIWKPAFFGVQARAHPEGRADRHGRHGRPECLHPHAAARALPPMFGAFGGAIAKTSLTFVSQAGLNAGIGERFGLRKTLSAVRNIRGVRKQHMVHNSYTPKMEVDAQTYTVRADGQLLTCEPATVLPMAQRYFLFTWPHPTHAPRRF